MKPGELRNLLARSGLNPMAGEQRMSVLVSLNTREPNSPELAHLAASGLTIDRVIGSTVLGTILPSQVAALQNDELVREVEASVQLRPHSVAEPPPDKC